MTVSAVEPSSNTSVGSESRAVLTVIREAGAFGAVDVTWQVVNPSADLSVSSGVLTFAEGQRSAVLEIAAEPDDDPEPAETYTVELTSASGGARLASTSITATLTILPNDDPIRFSSSFARASEGDTVTFTLVRGGQANGK